MKPHIVAFIFARGGSKGVPGKNIRLLAGKPLIAHAIESAQAVQLVNRVIVSTDSLPIAKVAKTFGAEVPFLRPAELGHDDSPEWLAWRHAIESVQAEPGARKLDVFLSLPATSPLRDPEDIEACIRALLDSEADIVITVTQARRSPYFNMVVLDDAKNARLVIEPLKPVARRQDAPLVYDMTTVAYAARPEFVLRSSSVFEGRVKAVFVPEDRAIDIDTELDFQLAELLFANKERRAP